MAELSVNERNKRAQESVNSEELLVLAGDEDKDIGCQVGWSL